MGEWDGKEDARDEEIFYYFSNEKEVIMNMKEDKAVDFIITKYYRQDNV